MTIICNNNNNNNNFILILHVGQLRVLNDKKRNDVTLNTRLYLWCFVWLAPSRESSPRFSWSPLTTADALLGDNVTLECAAEAWPVPTMTWQRHGGLLPVNRHQYVLGQFEKKTLTLQTSKKTRKINF